MGRELVGENEMRGIVLAALVIVAALPAWGYDGGKFRNLGFGTKSCGSWQEARKEDNAAAAYLVTWITGYLTGYNAWVEGKADITEGTDIAGLLGWLDNYCAQNPLENVASAASALVIYLRSR